MANGKITNELIVSEYLAMYRAKGTRRELAAKLGMQYETLDNRLAKLRMKGIKLPPLLIPQKAGQVARLDQAAYWVAHRTDPPYNPRTEIPTSIGEPIDYLALVKAIYTAAEEGKSGVEVAKDFGHTTTWYHNATMLMRNHGIPLPELVRHSFKNINEEHRRMQALVERFEEDQARQQRRSKEWER